mmetsp:Transcript_39226/g.59829  ORF Transcript_39226/g.59829 Transcript_39226/m.59829 type:complete len:349 (+) Transcript_39226:4172-5218(+)
MLKWIVGVPEFELKASRALEPGHVPLTAGWQSSGLELRPLRVRFGVLQSDFRDGLAKFFNKNPLDVIDMLRSPDMVPSLLAVMKQPDSYAIRERIARDIDQTIKLNLLKIAENEERGLLGVRLVWILSKFNPGFLCQPQHSDILQNLRGKWVKLGDYSIDNCLEGPQDWKKKLYRKLLKCLLTYCRNEKSDKQVLFDLLKGFSYQPLIDLSPLLKFTTEEVPRTFPIKKQIEIMETTLRKLEQSRGSYEQRYAMFEFAFMPLALMCVESQEKFDQLFSEQMIELFLNTFFVNQHWQTLQQNLENSSQVWYERFHIEIVKALCIILARIEGPRFSPFIKHKQIYTSSFL